MNIFKILLLKIIKYPSVFPFISKKISKFLLTRINYIKFNFWKFLFKRNNLLILYGINQKNNINDKQIHILNENGYLIIDNFLDKTRYKSLCELIKMKICEKEFSTKLISKTKFDYWKLNNSDFINTVNIQLNKIFNYYFNQPCFFEEAYLQRITCKNTELDKHDPDTLFHIDRFVPSLKIFYYPYEITLENAPFRYIKKTHIINDQYIDNYHSQSKKMIYQNNHIAPFTLPYDGQTEEIIVKENTLVVAWTHGLHSRKPFLKEGSRFSVRFITYDKIDFLKLLFK